MTTEFNELLSLRRREVVKHLALIRDLDDAVRSRDARGPVDAEHVNILKSAFLVHLYNVVEAVMNKILDEMAAATSRHLPDEWKYELFIAWVRHRAALEREMAPDDRLTHIVSVIAEAAGRKPLGSTRVAKREVGNWTHKEIESAAASLSCPLEISDLVKHEACVRFFVNDMSPLTYVRHMRNQLGHGNISFVDSAAALSVDQLGYLQVTIIDYMDAIVKSFTSNLDQKSYLSQPAA